MKITQEGDYALRVILYLYRCGIGKRMEAKSISEHENVPPRFLLRLLRKLTVADIIESHKGFGGGYDIVRNPSSVSVLEVIEAVEGPIAINKCLEADPVCNAGRIKSCPIHMALGSAQNTFVSTLRELTFDKFLK